MGISVISFLKEFLFTLFTLIGLGFIGGFALFPFLKDIRYAVFAAPVTGLLILTLGVACFYSIVGLSVANAMVIVIVAGCLLTSLCLIQLCKSQHKIISWPDKRLLGFGLVVCAFVVYVTNYATITLGYPGFLYMDGTDHLGYSQLADWLNTHRVTQLPGNDQNAYESWPHAMFTLDPRFGSFFVLAMVATLRGMSGMFSYGSACAIVLMAGYLGVTGIYARTPKVFAVLMIGLLSCAWINYAGSGFFGKILAYPSILFILGLFILPKLLSPIKIALLAMLTASVAIMYPGVAVAVFLAIVGGLCILSRFIGMIFLRSQDLLRDIMDRFVILLLLMGIAVVAMGTLSRPMMPLSPPIPETIWQELLPYVLDMTRNLFWERVQWIGSLIVILLSAGWCFFAISRRNDLAFALIGSSFLILFGVMILGVPGKAYQFAGILYPFSLCGAALLLNTEKQWPYILFISVVIVVSLHIPRWIDAVQRYAGLEVQQRVLFSKVEMDKLAEGIGGSPVIVHEITDPPRAIAALVELARRDVKLQWTPASWKTILGYRSWKAPLVDRSIPLYLQMVETPVSELCTVKVKTAQYQLLYCKTPIL